MKRYQQYGFTLIEIMIVVFVIGMAISAISLSVGGNSATNMVYKDTKEFMLRASYIAEQSVLKGETHGLFVQPQPVPGNSSGAGEQWCYQWRRVRDKEWQDLPELPEPYCLAEGLVIEFVIDDKTWEYDPELDFQEPVMGFYPSGDGSAAVEIAIYPDGATTRDDEIQRIELSVMGELTWVNEAKRLAAEKKGLL